MFILIECPLIIQLNTSGAEDIHANILLITYEICLNSML